MSRRTCEDGRRHRAKDVHEGVDCIAIRQWNGGYAISLIVDVELRFSRAFVMRSGRPGLELIDLPFGGQMTQIELDRRERSGVTDDPKI